ncbi:hypothetical protein ACWC5I_32740, partial [Kitasatospora sp. NPDC001574]
MALEDALHRDPAQAGGRLPAGRDGHLVDGQVVLDPDRVPGVHDPAVAGAEPDVAPVAVLPGRPADPAPAAGRPQPGKSGTGSRRPRASSQSEDGPGRMRMP